MIRSFVLAAMTVCLIAVPGLSRAEDNVGPSSAPGAGASPPPVNAAAGADASGALAPVAGQEPSSLPALADTGADTAARSAPDWEDRLALARRMNEIDPASVQLDDAIVTIAARLPIAERKGFEIAMKKILDYKTLETTSIEAMAETFTRDELQAMVTYNESPQARSIARKFPAYQARIQPKVFEMLDRAMMQVRTGSVPGAAQ